MRHYTLTLLLLLTTSAYPQGELAPTVPNGALDPAGNPQPSMKTLQQIFDRIEALHDDRRTPLSSVPGDAGSHHRITAPGSYVLTADLDVTKLAGIWVQADDVTLDLNGFQVRRTAGAAGSAIHVHGTSDRFTVENGSLAGGTLGFQVGLDCPTTAGPFGSPVSASSGTVSRLRVSGCVQAAVRTGNSWQIDHCHAYDNAGDGITTGHACILDACSARFNRGAAGIHTGDACTLTACSAVANQGTYGIRTGDGGSLTNCTVTHASTGATSHAIHAGAASTLHACNASGATHQGATEFTAIRCGAASTLTACTAGNNTTSARRAYAIDAGDGSTLRGCTASGNTFTGEFDGIGIRAGSGCSLHGCTAHGNAASSFTARGIAAGFGSVLSSCNASANSHTGGGNAAGIAAVGSTLSGCTANANTSGSTISSGFYVSDDSTLDHCKATANTTSRPTPTARTGMGIWAENRCTVKNCTASGNSGDGIRLVSRGLAEHNNCSENLNGIHAVLSSNAVLNNLLTGNATGLRVDATSTDSFALRNIAIDNETQFDIPRDSGSGLPRLPSVLPVPGVHVPDDFPDGSTSLSDLIRFSGSNYSNTVDTP